jgi:hypothetical protein
MWNHCRCRTTAEQTSSDSSAPPHFSTARPNRPAPNGPALLSSDRASL